MTKQMKIIKLINRKDGKGKEKLDCSIALFNISEKDAELVCSECKQLGIRTIAWKDDLYACKNIDCDVRWYWKNGFYFV